MPHRDVGMLIVDFEPIVTVRCPDCGQFETMMYVTFKDSMGKIVSDGQTIMVTWEA